MPSTTCHGTTKTGASCKKSAIANTNWCNVHTPQEVQEEYSGDVGSPRSTDSSSTESISVTQDFSSVPGLIQELLSELTRLRTENTDLRSQLASISRSKRVTVVEPVLSGAKTVRRR